MTIGAALFMAGSWTFVLCLMAWSFWRILHPKPMPRAGDAARRNGRRRP